MTAAADGVDRNATNARAASWRSEAVNIPAEKIVSLPISAGSLPTMSMPATSINSLICCTARSDSPLATSLPVKPLGMIVARTLTASAMPSLSISPAKKTPLAPDFE